MNIIVNGASGRMGREVCRMIDETEGMSVVAYVDKMGGNGMLQSICEFSGDADVIIDFSHHTASPELIEYAAKKNIPIVIATTGHDDAELEAINEGAKKVAVFMSANMSLGVALLVELAKKTARVFPDADIEIIEKHHNRKLDAPSGTALMIAKAIEQVRRGIKLVSVICHEISKSVFYCIFNIGVGLVVAVEESIFKRKSGLYGGVELAGGNEVCSHSLRGNNSVDLGEAQGFTCKKWARRASEMLFHSVYINASVFSYLILIYNVKGSAVFLGEENCIHTADAQMSLVVDREIFMKHFLCIYSLCHF